MATAPWRDFTAPQKITFELGQIKKLYFGIDESSFKKVFKVHVRVYAPP